MTNGVSVATLWKNGRVHAHLPGGDYGAKAQSIFVSGDDVYVVGTIILVEARG